MDFYHNRRTQLLRDGKEGDTDAVLVTDPTNVRYLCEFPAAEAVLVSAKGTFVVFPDDALPARKHTPPDLFPVPRADGADLSVAVAEAVRTAGAKSVGVEADHLTVATLRRFAEAVGKTSLRPLSGQVEVLRQSKDPSEVEAVRKAVGVASRALLMFRAILREIDTELDLVRQMDQLILRAGADAAAFPSVVALGDNSGLSVLRPTTDRPVAEASKLFVRWGVELGYCGVISRTFRSPFGAPPLRKTKAERTAHSYNKVSAAVRQAMHAAVEAVRPNATAGDVAKAAHAQLAAAGFDQFAAAEIGHGVGLAHREGPFLLPTDTTPLVPGMVLNITPQVRIPDWGMVKLSQTVSVTREGVTDLGGGPGNDE